MEGEREEKEEGRRKMIDLAVPFSALRKTEEVLCRRNQ